MRRLLSLIARCVLALAFLGALANGVGSRMIEHSFIPPSAPHQQGTRPASNHVITSTEVVVVMSLERATRGTFALLSSSRSEQLNVALPVSSASAQRFSRPHDPSHLHAFALLI